MLVVLIFGFFAFRSHVLSEARRKEAEADRELRRSVRDAERAMCGWGDQLLANRPLKNAFDSTDSFVDLRSAQSMLNEMLS